jgi:hypothetical protein
MTCKEMRARWENAPQAAADIRLDSSDFSEHIASCHACNRFVEEKRELAEYLQMERDSAPAIPVSLDVAVHNNFRRYVSNGSIPTGAWRRTWLHGTLGWAAPIAFAVVVAYAGIMVLVSRQQGWSGGEVAGQQQKIAPQVTSSARQEMATPPKRHRNKADRVIRPVREPVTQAMQTVAEIDENLPAKFQSLMYCDQISCPGAMEVIRMQFPPPLLGLAPRSGGANELISADVLVGQDGIARGIRVVE